LSDVMACCGRKGKKGRRPARSDSARSDSTLDANDGVCLIATDAEKQRRLQSAVLYKSSAEMAFLGFAFCACLGFWKILAEPLKRNYTGQQYASGWNYFPLSVSEMAGDPNDPEAMVFQAFMVLAAIVYLLSGAPWNLRNLYIGGRGRARGLLFIRHLGPAFGFLTLAMIRFTSPGRATRREEFSSNIHLLGAGGGFGSYIALEVWTLARPGNAHIKGLERIFRWLTILGSVAFAICFIVLSTLAKEAHRLGLTLCCDNVWKVPDRPSIRQIWFASSAEDMAWALDAARAHVEGRVDLLDTAKGWVLALRCCSFFSEVFMGLCAVGNMLVIWAFCEERWLVLADQLPQLHEVEFYHSSDGEEEPMGRGRALQRRPSTTARRRDATPGAPERQPEQAGAGT